MEILRVGEVPVPSLDSTDLNHFADKQIISIFKNNSYNLCVMKWFFFLYYIFKNILN